MHLQRFDVAGEPCRGERLSDRRRRNVVFDDHDHDQDLAGMLVEKGRERFQFMVERFRAELAEGMAEIRLRLALQCAEADTAGHSVCDSQRACRHLLGDLVAIGALGSGVGPDPPAVAGS